jgi:hypothetical protein
MKTAELSGAALDWAVAKCEGTLHDDGTVPDYYQPSVDWENGGAIIECEGISLDYDGLGTWIGTIITNGSVFEKQGATPLVAAMRCYVASKLGNEVQIPEELTNENPN